MEGTRQAAGRDDGVQAPPRRRRWRRIAAVCGIVTLTLLTGTAGGGYLLLRSYEQEITRIPNAFPPEDRRLPPASSPGETWLVVGSDRSGPFWTHDERRSDVLMLVRLSSGASPPQALSLARDSWVPIPGHGTGKIGDVFALGGSPLLVETVEHLMRVRIDHFATLDFTGLENVIDILGGVDLGGRHLNGQAALGYVRGRSACGHTCDDRGGAGWQQAFLHALGAKATDIGLLANPFRVDALIRAFTRSVSVDSTVDIRRLAGQAAQLSPGSTRIETPRSRASWMGPEPVLLLDASRARAQWAAMLGGSLPS
jgi:LCP family protein required for cell wall assembly